ncbi:hypothetical protein D9623_33730 (plasmid) [Azospirillum brasilense]|nr:MULTISPECIES: deaminase [Azospirillum]MDW7555402.1 deaminase [Azospirillum brasilense]MDW7595190.1 deaminase [Azospirillum brasilense]MDW7630343.1 deaminase [Azospirillum brasilense]MDX5949711.1 deaminase [Azospirillum brasilense]PWC94773.1 hypothetical protein AEJ54_08570 [Azospirillum sp. Sp 7]
MICGAEAHATAADQRFMTYARHQAAKSKDPCKQVGAVVVGPLGEIRAIGHNRLPGDRDCPDTYADKRRKRERIVHAEVVAITSAARAGVALDGGTLFVTHPCCADCARMLVEAGIVEVVWPEQATFSEHWQESLREAEDEFARAGVRVRRMVA